MYILIIDVFFAFPTWALFEVKPRGFLGKHPDGLPDGRLEAPSGMVKPAWSVTRPVVPAVEELLGGNVYSNKTVQREQLDMIHTYIGSMGRTVHLPTSTI